MLSETDRLLIALSLLPRVGRKLLRAFLRQPELFDECNVNSLFVHLSHNNANLLKQFLSKSGALYDKIEHCQTLLHQFEIHFISANHPQFPPQLLHIPDYPPFLFYKGDIDLASQPQVAIVGSRNASRSSLQHAFSFSHDLAKCGLVITSGLAQGVDAYAHSGATNNGFASIAVMGTGLDTIYPKKHLALANKLLEHGCWISEYLPGSKPIASNFPRRNRIISGLSLAVLIVEARSKSGTLITARMAIEQNRDVFAIPGPIDYEGSTGCHDLIRDGAILTQNYNDILECLSFTIQSSNQQEEHVVSECKLPQNLMDVLEQVDFTPASLEVIGRDLNQGSTELQSILMELELGGYIECIAGQYQRIK